MLLTFRVSDPRPSGFLRRFPTGTIGRKPGETKMVKNGDAVEAHQVESAIHPITTWT